MTKLLQFRRPDSAAAPAAEWHRRPAQKIAVAIRDLCARAEAAISESRALTEASRLRRKPGPNPQRPQMLDFVAHDLMNDIGAAQMCATALQQREPALRQGGSADYLRVLRQSLVHMEQFVGDLRDSRQMQLGRFVLNPTAVSPAALVSAAADAAACYTDGRNLALVCAPGLPFVRADEPRIQRVFANLIGNAVKFTDTQGTISVGARPGTTPDEVMFFVRDDGEGMTDADQRRIFEAGWQPREGGRSGTGLGLMICRGIVEAHGGKIFVTSRPNVGSTFEFALRSAARQQTDRAAE